MAAYGAGDGHVNPKLPTWDGSWKTFSDYRFACQLEFDGCKDDDKALLAPRLVRNLTGRAWECSLEVEREELCKSTGVEYLLKFLRDRRGKEHVDLLGDAFHQYFQTGDAVRREGENLTDYEQRHAHFLRDIDKAMVEIGGQNKVPREIFGWFTLNQLMRLDASDVAVIKAQSGSYKVEDIFASMRKMWGGESLSQRDAERKKSGGTVRTYAASSHRGQETSQIQDSAMMNAAQDEEPNDSEADSDLEESQAWFEQAVEALTDRPQDESVLANFHDARRNFYKEARRALDKHRVSRGFYPNPTGKGKGKDSGSRGFQGRCMRCGKVGHKAMQCKQNVSSGSMSSAPSSKNNESGRVGFVFASGMGEMNAHDGDIRTSGEEWTASSVTWNDNPEVISLNEETYAVLTDEVRTKAILDCGASESIIGAFTLQNLYDQFADMGLNPEEQISIDRSQRRSFIFGNNETSLSLGYANITVGVAGRLMKIPIHVVEGQTPMLLSSRWLEEHSAVIDFRTGKASFGFLDGQDLQLERASTNHLLLPVTAFPDAKTVSADPESHCEAFANRRAAVPE